MGNRGKLCCVLLVMAGGVNPCYAKSNKFSSAAISKDVWMGLGKWRMVDCGEDWRIPREFIIVINWHIEDVLRLEGEKVVEEEFPSISDLRKS